MAEGNEHQCKLEDRMKICERMISDTDKTTAVMAENFKNLNTTVSEIKESLKWFTRTVTGALILSSISTFIALTKLIK